ncbi:unnamed protein product [Linum tenue]|uniref:Transposase MuDR plant domain-containing protein n=1 Tax=Linum tenue TaxID=586396 RepID=A0AAV0RWW6_9ROSI|nr:unnamed protein product [Linum tenue]
MGDTIQLVLTHGGAMNMLTEVPQYVGGVRDVVNCDRDVLSYFEIVKTLIEDFGYLSVERVWYLTPGESMTSGLHEICTDADVINGLLGDAEKGELVLFFDATKDLGEFAENYGHNNDGSDDESENSAIEEFLRLDDDGTQTSDEEYHEIRANVRRLRKDTRLKYYGTREDVDKIFEEDNEPIDNAGDNGNVRKKGNVIPTYDGNYNSGKDGNYNSAASLEEDVDELSMEKYLFYDPNCDHETLNFIVHMRFASPKQFQEAIIKHSIAIGADIRWIRSSERRKEAVCANKCGWRVYASWFGKRETFMVKGFGIEHSCPRSLHKLRQTYIGKLFTQLIIQIGRLPRIK